VSRRRTTFGKLQRDRDKQAKARAKIERRQERSEQGDGTDEPATPAPAVDQAAVLAQLADLHAAFDDGKISFDEFESRRDELTSKLRVD
jgi:Gas vesicle protein G